MGYIGNRHIGDSIWNIGNTTRQGTSIATIRQTDRQTEREREMSW